LPERPLFDDINISTYPTPSPPTPDSRLS
jgi:hypothetical protein